MAWFLSAIISNISGNTMYFNRRFEKKSPQYVLAIRNSFYIRLPAKNFNALRMRFITFHHNLGF